jgi:iron(III) transport system ATP-binding protein
MNSSTPFLKIDKVSKRFGKTAAIKDVSLELAHGGSLVIMGPSGSGKTTLLRLIAGLEQPDEGAVYLKGKLVSSKNYLMPPHLRKLGFVFQTPALWPHMTVRENIVFGLSGLPKKDADDRAAALMRNMEIENLAARYPEQISGGEARRASLARALAFRPECLLMDEPLINLDHDLKLKLLGIIGRTLEEHRVALVFVTHDESEAREIKGQRWLLKGGVLNG